MKFQFACNYYCHYYTVVEGSYLIYTNNLYTSFTFMYFIDQTVQSMNHHTI